MITQSAISPLTVMYTVTWYRPSFRVDAGIEQLRTPSLAQVPERGSGHLGVERRHPLAVHGVETEHDRDVLELRACRGLVRDLDLRRVARARRAARVGRAHREARRAQNATAAAVDPIREQDGVAVDGRCEVLTDDVVGFPVSVDAAVVEEHRARAEVAAPRPCCG